jgi:hypothetical protein
MQLLQFDVFRIAMQFEQSRHHLPFRQIFNPVIQMVWVIIRSVYISGPGTYQDPAFCRLNMYKADAIST